MIAWIEYVMGYCVFDLSHVSSISDLNTEVVGSSDKMEFSCAMQSLLGTEQR